MTDDLVTWLREQIAEDEDAARAAGGCRWQRDGISCVEDADNRSLVVYGEGTPSQEEADHIARHDPAVVLAQCEAHTAIVDKCANILGWGMPYDYRPRKLARGTLRLLALAYRHRAGYCEEWRP